ncbi:MAG: hypothetical protein FWC15_04025 [Fibromonadales bacterium]|nr:hypothetical protein [Fibromonadales bacterium]
MSYNISSKYISSSNILDESGEKRIKEKYDLILLDAEEFIKKRDLENIVTINKIILRHAVIDYYTDILRLKSFHKLEKEDEVKTLAYEIFWFLKRKPLQIIKDDHQNIFINEIFALSRILSFISKDSEDNFTILTDTKFDYFTATLFYFLKYRIESAKSIELMLIAFEAGIEYQKAMKLSPQQDCGVSDHTNENLSVSSGN